ncbi:MAG: YihA family ribosome biogenesis GTP-binding protein [Rhizobiales bacterium]|nr:YihA family ribosome biogenesis GTP-binding protein [Hyphomicrobiales bacterium]
MTDDLIEEGVSLFRQPIDFVKGVVAESGLPPADRPEIAFAGRSNVGKSSLINALCNRKNLARTSNTPGRTREINYFTIGEEAFLVDMPGYGFAKVPKEMVAGWTKLIEKYLRGRHNLKRTFVLIDSRHGIKKKDLEIMEKLDSSAVLYQIVLTKTDKIKTGELQKRIAETETIIKKHPAAFPLLIATSSNKGDGIDELKGAIILALNS